MSKLLRIAANAIWIAAVWAITTSNIESKAQESTGVQAKSGKQAFATLEALNASYEEQRLALDKRQLDDLAALAANQQGDSADAAYAQLFQMAIARNLYGQAERAADRVIADKEANPEIKTLARFTKVVAEADRGAFDASLADLETFVRERPQGNAEPDPRRTATVLAVGEAYLQRLIHGGRYDIARKVCQLAVEKAADPAVKEHFGRRLERLAMLGRPAPMIEGTDVDGRPVRMADLKGKVILVDFWASWCPPSSGEMSWLNELVRQYGGQGFAVMGVNLDAAREGAGDARAVKSAVSKFLIDHRVTWPSALNGAGEKDFAKAYGVSDVPANFLIGRDGKILHVELDQANARRVVASALGGKSSP